MLVGKGAGNRALDWKSLAITIGIGLVLAGALAAATVWWFTRREPYASFNRLTVRGKLTFLRLLVVDRRLPWYVRALPLMVLVYWVSPLDLIPLVPFDDVAFSLVALAVMVWLTPRELIAELLRAADDAHPAAHGD